MHAKSAQDMSSFSLLSSLLLVVLLQLPTSTTAASYYDQYSQQSSSSSSAYDVLSPRRERNLDHWDADTAAAYLGLTRSQNGDEFTPLPPQDDIYAGHDAAILFYAQWCQNCHALAPSYDAIGTLMEAGTTKSNLILALFDCERDAEHMALCRAVGVQAYPTVMFVGSGPYHDRDPFTARFTPRSKNKMAGTVPKELKRVVQFAGDWRYADQVLDWIKCMRGLSRWHRLNTEGWLSVLRRGIFGLLRKPDMTSGSKAKSGSNSLPVGVPPQLVQARASGGGGGMNTMSTAETTALQKKVTTLETQMKSYDDLLKTSNEAVLHASYTVDSFLLPTVPKEGELGADCVVKTAYPPYVDVYAALKTSDGWDATAESGKASGAGDVGDETDDDAATSPLSDEYLLRSCVVDLSLDYCTRVSTRVTTDYLDELERIPEADYPKMSDLDALLTNRTDAVEPYCSTFTECYLEEFMDDAKCRPDTCPFKNEAACRYVANCLDARIKKEYVEALTAIGETAEQRAAAAAAAASDKKSTGGSKAWGVA